ncbi:hypothetical protein PPK15_gp90 [Bacillus phage 000TH010]|uniref:Uncharacterized protein n=1 Tax=Bacillus phage 000TH010 TaxID=2601652 RepID=A0A5P8PHX7_9CAUD|nr:hypothetical protein PPK15_gp90 [Bacillus phage 000TH010]QFR56303.1 hypothetical protein 000TH010_90 [Bacillus phage 000TH010]
MRYGIKIGEHFLKDFDENIITKDHVLLLTKDESQAAAWHKQSLQTAQRIAHEYSARLVPLSEFARPCPCCGK